MIYAQETHTDTRWASECMRPDYSLWLSSDMVNSSFFPPDCCRRSWRSDKHSCQVCHRIPMTSGAGCPEWDEHPLMLRREVEVVVHVLRTAYEAKLAPRHRDCCCCIQSVAPFARVRLWLLLQLSLPSWLGCSNWAGIPPMKQLGVLERILFSFFSQEKREHCL